MSIEKQEKIKIVDIKKKSEKEFIHNIKIENDLKPIFLYSPQDSKRKSESLKNRPPTFISTISIFEEKEINFEKIEFLTIYSAEELIYQLNIMLLDLIKLYDKILKVLKSMKLIFSMKNLLLSIYFNIF
jgi:hypothetical protein